MHRTVALLGILGLIYALNVGCAPPAPAPQPEPIIIPVDPYHPHHPEPIPIPVPVPYPVPGPRPCPGPGPCPKPEPHKPHRPHRDTEGAIAPRPVLVAQADADKDAEKITTGGPLGPDGVTQVATDLPVDQRTKNVGGSDGSGLCVFSSIGHAARWQNENTLKDLQKWMRKHPGGGYPEKVTRMIAQKCKEMGCKVPLYINHTGSDPAILATALASGRMPCVTYNGRDHVHYNGSISHMVNLVAYDEKADLACVLDNNFVAEDSLVWMSCKEFLERWRGGGGGWCVVLLNPGPPPCPRN